MGTQISDKEFKDIIYEKFNHQFLIDEYRNMKTSIKIKCNKCKTIKSISPEKLMYTENPEWCDKCTDELRIKQQIEKIKTTFPLIYNSDMNIYLDDVLYIGNDKRKRYWVNFHDNFNYKYQLEYGSLIIGIENNRLLRRFFQRNPFTYDNIQNYLNINNISMKLITKNLYSNAARKHLEFTDKNNNTIFISWNDIQNHTERYIDSYYDTLYHARKVREFTKEEVIKIIYNMQSKLDRPLYQDDFASPTDETIGIRIVEKYWGGLCEMQKDLGLMTSLDLRKKVTKENYLKLIKDVCNDVYTNENRKILIVDDFKKYGVAYAKSYDNACKSNGTTLRNVLISYDFKLQKAGNGFNYTFEDKERVVSMHEYEFSKYIKRLGLVYNQDYFRDVRYDKLTTEYKGNMNCDYEIHFQGRIFYIELAGILGNLSYEICYRENKTINSKSKEKYRLDLLKKKSIFENEKLEHYILLPSEMNEETYKKILNNAYIEVA